MRFWMWSFSGFIWWSRSLSLMLGLSARWGSARGWVMFSLREHDITMLRSRYLLARRGGGGGGGGGGYPPCPVLAPPGLGGLLRLMVRVFWGSQWELPCRVHLRGPLTPPAHRTVWCSRMSSQGPRTGRAQHLIRSTSRWQDVDRCIGGWARFWRGRFGCAASVRKSSDARVRSRTDRYAFPGRWEHRAAL